MKEDSGGSLTAYAIGTTDEIAQILHTAIAKGADSAIKLGDDLGALDAHAQVEVLAGALGSRSHDVILCGVQASDEIDGQVAMLLSARLGYSHVSVVVGASPTDAGLTVTKEYWAGITATYDVTLPAVLGVQAARQPPRYVAIARIRQAQESGALSEVETSAPAATSGITITAMRIPESASSARMIDGDEEAAAVKIMELLAAAGVRGGP